MITFPVKLYGENRSKKLIFVDFTADSNYFKDLKKCIKQGLHQFIISSEIMIKILSKYTAKDNIKLVSIDFYMADNELEKNISSLITKINNNSIAPQHLLDELTFISDNESIDIEKIELQHTVEPYYRLQIYMNGNTFIEISKKQSPNLITTIKNELLNCIIRE